MSRIDRELVLKGRGATSNPAGRFESLQAQACDDGWGSLDDPPRRADTVLQPDHPRRAITHNASPDVPFERSINPYQGCEHGCVYCFARPSHSYWNLGPGLDFETRIFYKPGLARLLDRELRVKGYVCKPINLGANTDPYQPAEREHGTTRELLEVLLAHRHPVTIVTKGTLVLRDLDLLGALAAQRLAAVMVSLTTLDPDLKLKLEPRAAAPVARLRIIERLTAAGVPVGVLLAPIIPAINDHEIERLVESAAAAGAISAAWLPVRLPHELGTLFTDWLQAHYAERAERVLSLIRQMRGGRLNDPRFGHRMRGEGEYAALLARRFEAAARRHGLDRRRGADLDVTRFVADPAAPTQAELFT
jgi:DNA repair photolyase